MDRDDQSLIPFSVLAPPGPAQTHHAPVQPTQTDLEVKTPFPHQKIYVRLTDRSSDAIGQKRSLTTSLIQRQGYDTDESKSSILKQDDRQQSTQPRLISCWVCNFNTLTR
jgi:hypothetical protein